MNCMPQIFFIGDDDFFNNQSQQLGIKKQIIQVFSENFLDQYLLATKQEKSDATLVKMFDYYKALI